ncbi:hypothetical protein EDB83DRAFT_2524230 [Lactarius deliciosus]|nr:hypothetical protein EDB83DRAFT_2524230 [Lactarius deliciosus]
MVAVTCCILLRANAEAEDGHLILRSEYEPQDDGVCVVRLLLERGADVNKQRRNDHCMALHSASYWRKIGVVQLFLEHGASTNVEASTGATPLHSVSWGEHSSQEEGVRIGRLLLEHGADRLQLAQLLLENAVIFHAQSGETTDELGNIVWNCYTRSIIYVVSVNSSSDAEEDVGHNDRQGD